MKYILELTDEQAHALSRACELLTRVGVNQLDDVAWNMSEEAADIVRDELRGFSDFFRNRGMSYSIRNEKVPKNSQIAYDIMQVVRHQLALDRQAAAEAKGEKLSMMGVDFNEPLFVYDEENPPTIKTKK